jgi:hypothetical protein
MTFAMWYEYSERFVNPLSHDEVVHLKKSLLEKMPGDVWQKLANVRALMGYSVTRPGKSLFFMGMELGTHHEWNHDASLEWHLLEDPRRRGLLEYVCALGALYRQLPCLWRGDHDPNGYRWIDVADREQQAAHRGVELERARQLKRVLGPAARGRVVTLLPRDVGALERGLGALDAVGRCGLVRVLKARRGELPVARVVCGARGHQVGRGLGAGGERRGEERDEEERGGRGAGGDAHGRGPPSGERDR